GPRASLSRSSGHRPHSLFCSMSDYFASCFQAEMLGRMRTTREKDRCREQGITPEMKQAATQEMDQLWVGFGEAAPAEQLRRYRRMFKLFRIRGYFRDPDPAFDLIAIETAEARMKALAKQVA